MRQLLFLLSLAALAPFANSGCESTAATAGTEETVEDGGEPASLTGNGGYDSEDEAPMFGLPSMGQFGADPEAGDPSHTGEGEAAAEAVEGAEVYLLRIVWGNLELNGFDGEDRTEPHPDWLDWSGTLALEGKGGLILKRTILFDPHDHIVPEDDRHRIEWISHTGPHLDGLLVKVIYLPNPAATEPSITFTTSPVTQTIPIADLDHYNEIALIDEDGHGAAFTALRVGDDDCLEGFLAGKWHDRPEGEGGVFRGRALSERGALNGHIRGHYGITDDGNPVFFGKYINTAGHFRGLFRGAYGGGAFEGDWVSADGALEGTLSGKYINGGEADQGFFQGFWAEACD
jgi:hypothetical protein